MRHVNSANPSQLNNWLRMARTPMPTSLAEIAERLRISREALGFSISTMARLIGGSPPLWHNYESGVRRISLDKAFLLKARTGLTLEWIYYGDISTLPPHLSGKIQDQILRKNRPPKG
jgi:transcriptional regulator with XRE-family HTH domain